MIACIIGWYPTLAIGQRNGEQKLYIVAKGAYRDGFYDIAIGQLKKFLIRYPKSSLANPAKLMLAESLYQKKDFSGAISHYKTLLKNTKSDRLNYRLGNCYYQTGKYLQAATAFSHIARSRETEKFYPDSLYLQADSLLRMKKYEKAGKIYKKFIDKFPQNPYYKDALLGLGWSQFQRKRFAEAVDSLEIFIKEYPPIPQRARAQFLIAFSLGKLKKHSLAIAAYEKFLNNYPADKRAEEAQLRLGLALFESRFYNRAAALLEKYVLAHPENAAPYLFRIGLCYFRLEQYGKARQIFFKLNKKLPKNPFEKEALYYQGYCYLKQNKKKSAIKEFQKTVKKYPNTQIAKTSFLHIGILQTERKNYKEAIDAFGKAITSDDKAQAAQAQYRLADTLQKSNQSTRAIGYFRDLLKTFPKQKDWVELAKLKLAENLAAQGNFKDAEKNLEGLRKYRKAADQLKRDMKQKKNKNASL